MVGYINLSKNGIFVISKSLGEIIKSAGIIEDAKTAGIDPDHLANWGKLYDLLSDEERNCFYYSMKKYVLRPKTMILTYGALNNRLFLIDRGHVIIFSPKDGKNVVLAKLGPGDILGEYTFSTISLCSASAITHTEVQLMCLESSAADGWEEKYPGLYEKLIDFSLKFGRVDEIIRNKKQEKLVISTIRRQEG
ncbi:MAG: cyclic nucleotide-binding domain-containing protein [Chlorobiaceae bacterium]|nr:cyclic nucleotide-binding domain-containing protein [Chlorobiaceae bacterium]